MMSLVFYVRRLEKRACSFPNASRNSLTDPKKHVSRLINKIQGFLIKTLSIYWGPNKIFSVSAAYWSGWDQPTNVPAGLPWPCTGMEAWESPESPWQEGAAVIPTLALDSWFLMPSSQVPGASWMTDCLLV